MRRIVTSTGKSIPGIAFCGSAQLGRTTSISGRRQGASRGPLFATVVVCGLLTSIAQQAPAQQHSYDCLRLINYDSIWDNGVGRDKQKPQNLAASWFDDGLWFIGFNVSWEIDDEFPRSALTGHCIEWLHPETGKSEEICSTRNPRATSGRMVACYETGWARPDYECLRGSFDVRVRLTVNCNMGDLPWSNSISASAPPVRN